jgi:predicted RNase H-like nuclease (RuvC/YqgF family)
MIHEVESRLDSVEAALAEFIIQTNRMFHKGERETQALREEMKVFKDEMKVFKDEMKEFKDEMKEFKDEMKEFKDEMKEFKDEMGDFKDEMKEFKDEMKDFKDEMKNNIRELNQKWGEIANKLGTFAEDIAAPNIPRIAKENFGCQHIDFYTVRIDKADPAAPGEMAEFDAFVLADDKVFLLETKATIRMKYIEKLPDLLEQFRRCFPEYAGRQLIPVFGSMNIPENIVKRLSKLGFYAMAMGDHTMDIVNFDQVKKSIVL